MGKCKAGEYTSNDVILPPGGLVCYGGGKAMPAYKPCKHMEECLAEKGFKIITTKAGHQRVLRLKPVIIPKKGPE